MAKYFIEYTLPGGRGKVLKKSFSSAKARKKFQQEVIAKGGHVKSVSYHD